MVIECGSTRDCANWGAVLNFHRVVVTCRITKGGRSQWVLIRETESRLAQYSACCRDTEEVDGFFVLVVTGERLGRAWRIAFMAQLSQGVLRIACDAMLPWLREGCALPLCALPRRVYARRPLLMGMRVSNRDAAWREMAWAVSVAISDGAFVTGGLCSCSVEATCALCRHDAGRERVFRNVLCNLDVATLVSA
jgi:hypothetical protein